MIGWTLGRYLFVHYIKITAYFLLGIFILALLMDFTENAGRLSGYPSYTAMGAFVISALRIPSVMLELIPFVALFSAMASLISLNRRLELVVARSVGISAWQFLFPFCLGAFLFGIATVTLINPLAAWGANKSHAIVVQWTADLGLPPIEKKGLLWLTQITDEGRTTIGAKSTLEQGVVLIDATFVRYNADDSVKEWINAPQARLNEGVWTLSSASRRASGQPIVFEQQMEIKTNLRPEYVQERLADPQAIPFYELPYTIKVARSFGFSANTFDMHLQSLIALPVLLVAMTLIAATVSLRFARFGQSGVLILAGIFAGFVLYVVSVLVRAFGEAGTVPPVIAAWVPVVIALFIGFSFLLNKEDG